PRGPHRRPAAAPAALGPRVPTRPISLRAPAPRLHPSGVGRRDLGRSRLGREHAPPPGPPRQREARARPRCPTLPRDGPAGRLPPAAVTLPAEDRCPSGYAKP